MAARTYATGRAVTLTSTGCFYDAGHNFRPVADGTLRDEEEDIMAHTCKCGSRSGCSGLAVTAERTVADISHDLPGALEVLKNQGINHCCGAHLTLGEAAASAGASLEGLLEALRALEREPA